MNSLATRRAFELYVLLRTKLVHEFRTHGRRPGNALSGHSDPEILVMVRERWLLLTILALSVLVQCAMLELMPISISNDSFGYLSLARNVYSPDTSFERSVGYPLMIAASGAMLFDTLIPLIYLQCLMAISMPLIAYWTLRPLGRTYGLMASGVAIVSLYAYQMAVQVLTELPYMFSLSLFALLVSRYFFTQKLEYLVAATCATFLIMLLRVTSVVHFVSFALGIFLLAACSYRRASAVRIAMHGLLAVAIFGTFNVVYGSITDRTSGTVFPHFVFNWVYRGGTAINYGIVHPDNGPASASMFDIVGSIAERKPEVFRHLASGGSETLQSLAASKARYANEDIDALLDDLINNAQHPLRSWWIEGNLMSELGRTEAMELLRAVILEAFMAHPEALLWRAESSLEAFARSVTTPWGREPFYVSSFWHQMPPVGSASARPELLPRSFSMWVGSMDALTGTDVEFRQVFGRMPDTWAEAREAWTVHGNRIALGNYLTKASMNVARPVMLLCLIGIIFVFWSKIPALTISIISAALLPSFASVFMSEMDTRHILMAYPLQLVASLFVLEGIVGSIQSTVRYLLPQRIEA